MFNAQMAMLDNQGRVVPYLAKSVPQLNTDSWKIAPDGTMETIYPLQSNVTWHDGAPFTAEDFVFGWRVYTAPTMGNANLAPYNAIQEVVAKDPTTLVVRWKRSYPDTSFATGGLQTEFPPLPRHILESAFEPDQIEAFLNHPFFTREYVGLGPYKLEQWEPGAFIEGVAFPQHLLGAPKIQRVKLNFIGDARTALANILSGDVQLTDGTSVGLPEVGVLKDQQWMAQGKGGVFSHPNQWRAGFFQYRPDLVTPAALKNPMVRKALAYAADRALLNDSLYFGEGILSDSPVAPTSIWGPAAIRGAAAYPFDLRQSEQLMQQGGFSKGPDGVYASPAEGPFSFEVKTNQASDNESEIQVLADGWRRAGFDAHQAVLPAAQAQDAQARATFPGMYTNSQNCCESALLGLTKLAIPTAENRWSGGNRSGWTNPEYDRLVETFSGTIAQSDRETQLSQLVKIFTEDVAAITLFIRPQPWVYVSEIKGISLVPPEGNMSWNIYQWELT
jgi:peptide/nickel transport system substrate-binding protein